MVIDIEQLIAESYKAEANKWRSKAIMRANKIKELEEELRRLRGNGYD